MENLRYLQTSNQSLKKNNFTQIIYNKTEPIETALTNYYLDEVGVELGIYFFFMVLAMFAVLDKTNGNPIKHRDFLTFRKIEIFKNRHSNSDRI